MSLLTLWLKVLLWRGIVFIKRRFELYYSAPRPMPVSFTRTIPSIVGDVPGSFELFFYTPRSYGRSDYSTRYPVLINFHGGGFTIGHAEEDARWATAVLEQTSAVIISVNYRLAPRYPFPTPIEDCVSAIIWIWQHADELGLDISRTALSGFSAGGNLTYTVPIKLQEELTRLKAADMLDDVEIGNLTALISFYPSTDWTQTREERQASNPEFISQIPKSLYEIFDEAYLHSSSQLPAMSHPLLSPGLAPDDILRKALPEKMVMITCGGDALRGESEKFRLRLRGLGKRVDGYVVEGVPHGWDKLPNFKKPTPKRDAAYKFAVQSLREFWKSPHEDEL